MIPINGCLKSRKYELTTRCVYCNLLSSCSDRVLGYLLPSSQLCARGTRVGEGPGALHPPGVYPERSRACIHWTGHGQPRTHEDCTAVLSVGWYLCTRV